MPDASIIDDLATSFAQLDGVCGQLDEAGWATRSLCPDWDSHGVLTHVAAVEAVLDGWFPDGPGAELPFAGIGAYVSKAAELSGPELLADFRRLADARLTQLRALDPADLATPSPTPVGPQTYGGFMAVRVFDVWVHTRDIARPVGIETDDGGSAAETALEQVVSSMGYIAGKRIGLGEDETLRVALKGPVERDLDVAVVDGRAKLVPTIESPTTVLSTDSTTFLMLACGRIDPEGEIAAARVTWTGDDDLGRRAATSLRFTM